jgi:hypothetical protein
MGQNSCFVAVHFGAGFHSKDKESLFRKLMESCCILTLQNFEFSDNIIESLVLGIKVLEVSYTVYGQNIMLSVFRIVVY